MSTFSLQCPLCVTAVTTATDAGFSATTVEARPCEACQVRNPGLVSVTLRKSRGLELAVTETAVQHRDGLVAF